MMLNSCCVIFMCMHMMLLELDILYSVKDSAAAAAFIISTVYVEWWCNDERLDMLYKCSTFPLRA